MKKNLIFIILVLIALLLVGCKSDTVENETGSTKEDVETSIEPFDYVAHDLTSYVKLGKYKGLSITSPSAKLTDEEFEEEIEVLLEAYSYYQEYTDRAVEEGDSVRADFAGYKDGVAFQGGTATNVTLTAASNTGYIPGFAEAFIGKMPGEEFSFNVTFPENYGNEQLNGQEVTFVCTVHAILGKDLLLPELTDAFVAEHFNYNTVDEFRTAYRIVAENQKAETVKAQNYNTLWSTILENAVIYSYPEEEVNRLYNERKSAYEQYAVSYGIDYETLLATYLGKTDEDVKTECRTYVKEDLVLYQLKKELNIEVTEEEYQAKLDEFAERNDVSKEELLAYYGEQTLRSTALWHKLMDAIYQQANILNAD